MRRVLKGAVPLLAAAALGLSHPTAAPCSSPPTIPSVVAAESEDETQDLPRVVAPHRLVLEPMHSPSSLVQASPMVAPAGAAKPAEVDLLAPPPLPPDWSKMAASLYKAPIVPSGLPAVPTSVAAASPPPKVAMTHAPAPTPSAPAPQQRTWPAAFATAPDVPPAEMTLSPIRQAAHVEAPAAAVVAPIALNRLQQRVAVACGGAANVGVEVKQNGSVFVKVRLHSTAANQATAEKIMQIPEMTAPNVHLLMETGR